MRESEVISVFAIDDHQMVIDGIKLILQTDSTLNYAGSATNSKQALERLTSLPTFPDIIICDYKLGQDIGLELLEELQSLGYSFKYIILSMVMEGRIIRKCWEEGCNAFLGKNVSSVELLDTIKHIHAGKRYISSEQSLLLKKKPSLEKELSNREQEIFTYIVAGHSSKQIAEKLNISKRTVDNHRQNILKKTNSKNVVELISKTSTE